MTEHSETRIPCSKDTRESLKWAKRGHESYNELLQNMLEQYDPEEAHARQTRENA